MRSDLQSIRLWISLQYQDQKLYRLLSRRHVVIYVFCRFFTFFSDSFSTWRIFESRWTCSGRHIRCACCVHQRQWQSRSRRRIIGCLRPLCCCLFWGRRQLPLKNIQRLRSQDSIQTRVLFWHCWILVAHIVLATQSLRRHLWLLAQWFISRFSNAALF